MLTITENHINIIKIGVVGLEPTTYRLEGDYSTTELYALYISYPEIESNYYTWIFSPLLYH